MTSDPVARLNAALEGRYAIERELGEGGMATVYLADDLKHERKVALKVLKPELAAVVGAERFLAEIKTTANLTHPHILPLHDSGEADGFLFYVMPHIEGESLRERIDREKQLGVDDSVAITQKVANALDYAHGHGVVHRDIKPGNILLSEQGEPLIADFGIALAVAQAGAGRITETGLSLGTPHYMSPEQATGDRDVDPRSDVYALGCVLYEMLAGQPPFSATTAQAVLVKILTADAPSITSERRTVPPHVGHALARALEKLPADRFTSAAEFAAALGDPSFTYEARARTSVAASTPEPVATQAPATMPGPSKRLTIAATTLAALLAALAAWGWLRSPPAPEPGVPTRATVTGADMTGVVGWKLAISPDGRSILKVDGGSIHMRTASDPEWRQLPNTAGGLNPTFSPDGQSFAFDIQGRSGIRKVSIIGGPALPVTTSGEDPHWGFDNTIVYEERGRLYRVASSGGDPQVLLESDSVIARRPHLLPNGKAVVFGTGGAQTSRILIFEIETGEVRELVPAGNQPRYVSTGHLIYGHGDGALMGVPFDLETLQVTGAPVTLLPSLAVFGSGASQFAVSQTGTLVYRTGGSGTGQSVTPVWVERDGTAREIDPAWTTQGTAQLSSLALSPNEDRLAISIPASGGTTDLWVKQLDTGPLSRLTFEGATNNRATWSPNGESLRFLSNRAGNRDLWTKRADGSGAAELVLDQEAGIWEALYSSDGTWLVLREGVLTAGDIYAIRPGVDSVAVPLEVTEFQEVSISLSPNDRWLAYVANNTGRDEVYVRPFPSDAGSGLVQVSTDGGLDPVFAHNGRELFYRNGANELVAVQFTGDPTFVAGQQEVLFPMDDYLTISAHAKYDVSPDDQRFVMLRINSEDAVASEIIMVTNWFTELRGRMGN